jgi:hypothetical protein
MIASGNDWNKLYTTLRKIPTSSFYIQDIIIKPGPDPRSGTSSFHFSFTFVSASLSLFHFELHMYH